VWILSILECTSCLCCIKEVTLRKIGFCVLSRALQKQSNFSQKTKSNHFQIYYFIIKLRVLNHKNLRIYYLIHTDKPNHFNIYNTCADNITPLIFENVFRFYFPTSCQNAEDASVDRFVSTINIEQGNISTMIMIVCTN